MHRRLSPSAQQVRIFLYLFGPSPTPAALLIKLLWKYWLWFAMTLFCCTWLLSIIDITIWTLVVSVYMLVTFQSGRNPIEPSVWLPVELEFRNMLKHGSAYFPLCASRICLVNMPGPVRWIWPWCTAVHLAVIVSMLIQSTAIFYCVNNAGTNLFFYWCGVETAHAFVD